MRSIVSTVSSRSIVSTASITASILVWSCVRWCSVPVLLVVLASCSTRRTRCVSMGSFFSSRFISRLLNILLYRSASFLFVLSNVRIRGMDSGSCIAVRPSILVQFSSVSQSQHTHWAAAAIQAVTINKQEKGGPPRSPANTAGSARGYFPDWAHYPPHPGGGRYGLLAPAYHREGRPRITIRISVRGGG